MTLEQSIAATIGSLVPDSPPRFRDSTADCMSSERKKKKGRETAGVSWSPITQGLIVTQLPSNETESPVLLFYLGSIHGCDPYRVAL
jgi:hypothetical protein